jgi:hypothetical protein
MVFWLKVGLFLLFSTLQVRVKAWEIDFSRRQKDFERMRAPASAPAGGSQASSREGHEKDRSWLQSLFSTPAVAFDVVVLITEKGFVPEALSLVAGRAYQIHVVNLHGEKKPMSFMLQAFNENHGLGFGERKSFRIDARQTGTFAFFSPELNQYGKLFVRHQVPAEQAIPVPTRPLDLQLREPASSLDASGSNEPSSR